MQTAPWPLIDELMQLRDVYQRIVGAGDLPEWGRFNGNEFDRLLTRRTRIIEWLSTCMTRPEIVFVGTIHRAPNGTDTEKRIASIERVQAWAYEIVVQEMTSADVIVIEQAGSDAPLTAESYAKLGAAAVIQLGDNVGIRKMRRMLEKDTGATSRIVLFSPRPPVICGEDWPLILCYRIVRLAPNLRGERLSTADQLAGVLSRLRSELILIRSLEWLRRNNGSKAIILQGKGHGPHLAELQPLYRISLRLILPT